MLAKSVQFPVSDCTIQRVIHCNKFHHKKVRFQQYLMPRHCHDCLVFAQSHMSWNQLMWYQVVFIDKKQFNLVRNDAYQSIWVEGKKIYTHEIGRTSCDGLMVWGSISCDVGLHLICINERIMAETYCHMLENDFFHETEVSYLKILFGCMIMPPCMLPLPLRPI